MPTGDLIISIAAKLSQEFDIKKLFIGFDGFVDEIIEAVDTRLSMDKYNQLETIPTFAERVSSFSGIGGNIEMVTMQKKLGGNGPIMASAMLEMGQSVYYAGNIGLPDIEPVFQVMAESCINAYSVAPAAHTDAIEFTDGKIMLTRSATLNGVTWENLVANVGKDKLRAILSEVDFIAANNWSQIIKMNGIWQGIMAELKSINRQIKPYFFCDLSDPRKRTGEDIKTMLSLLTEMNTVANVILGLNKNEAKQIASILGVIIQGDAFSDLVKAAKNLQEKLLINTVVIHPIDFACASQSGQTATVMGNLVEKPKLSTGAGDNFNAGFCYGLLQGFSLEESLVLGIASSGYYIRNAHSGNKEQLIEFLKSWNKESGI